MIADLRRHAAAPEPVKNVVEGKQMYTYKTKYVAACYQGRWGAET
jgi:hypothetical protein